MSCPKTLTGIEVSCEGSAGGIKRVLVAPRDYINLPAPVDNAIAASAITATQSGVTFVEYKFRPQTGSLTSTSTIDTAIGSSSIESVLSLQFTRMESSKRVAIQQAINAGSVAIVGDYNGNYWLLGYDMPIYATSAVAQSGQAIGDLNGYTLELTDVSFELPYPIGTESDINALLTSVPTA